MKNKSLALVLGGGATGSAIATYLYRANFPTAIVLGDSRGDLQRRICFSEAAKVGRITIADCPGILIAPEDLEKEFEANAADPWKAAVWYHIRNNTIPIWIRDEFPDFLNAFTEKIIIKTDDGDFSDVSIGDAELVIGLYPEQKPGQDCNIAVETRWNYWLGSVYRQVPPLRKALDSHFFKDPFEDIKAPIAGVFFAIKEIGDYVRNNEAIGKINDIEIRSPYQGEIWGLLHSGQLVETGAALVRIFQGRSDAAYTAFSFYQRAIAGAVLREIIRFANL